MARVPDFEAMRNQGLSVFEEGLPPLPKELKDSDTVPVSYWTTDMCGAVQFLFFLQPDEGGSRPADVTFQYSHDERGWHSIKKPMFWGGHRHESIPSPTSMRQHLHQAIETSHSALEDEPAPGQLAIVMSGRHAPEVAEIWLIQGGRTEKRPASGHFGSWTICTEVFEPFRVEAHDSEGALLGLIDEPLEAYFPERPLSSVTAQTAARPHRHGGHVQIQEIERYESKTVVKWTITLEPDPDVQLAEDLEAHGFESADPWSLERIAEHVKLIDVLKLTVSFSQISLTDDLGTEYEGGGGGMSVRQGTATKSSGFEPSIPEDAKEITVHWEDLDFRVPLH